MNSKEYMRDLGEANAEVERQKRRAWLERQGREEDDLLWPRETSDDDPYGEDDREWEELE